MARGFVCLHECCVVYCISIEPVLCHFGNHNLAFSSVGYLPAVGTTGEYEQAAKLKESAVRLLRRHFNHCKFELYSEMRKIDVFGLETVRHKRIKHIPCTCQYTTYSLHVPIHTRLLLVSAIS
jgi:hypothetical protein